MAPRIVLLAVYCSNGEASPHQLTVDLETRAKESKFPLLVSPAVGEGLVGTIIFRTTTGLNDFAQLFSMMRRLDASVRKRHLILGPLRVAK